MRKKPRRTPARRLRLHRETLRTLESGDLSEVAGQAPTRAFNCLFTNQLSTCATCLC